MLSGCKCCKDCEKRKVNCHAWCEEYQEWQKAHRKDLDDWQDYKRKQTMCGYYGSLEKKTKYLQQKKREMWRR